MISFYLLVQRKEVIMKVFAVVAVAGFMLSVSGASACEWNKQRQQSVKAPASSTVATLITPQPKSETSK